MNLLNRVISLGDVSLRVIESADFELFFGKKPSVDTVLKVGEYSAEQIKRLTPENTSSQNLEQYWFHLDLFEVAERLYTLRNTVMYNVDTGVFESDI